MKSLSDNILGGKDGSSDIVYLLKIDGGTYRWATSPIDLSGNEVYTGGIIVEDGFSPIRQSIDLDEGGNVAHISDFSFQLANPQYSGQTRLDENIAHSLENRDIEVRMIFTDQTPLNWINTLLLFKGIIKDIKINYGIYEISCVDKGFLRHKLIPENTITKADYPKCPERNIGKPIPLIYGDFYTGHDSYTYNQYNFIPLIMVNENKPKFIVSLNKCRVVDYTLAYFFDHSINRALQVYTGITTNLFTPTNNPSTTRPTYVDIILGLPIYGRMSTALFTQGSKTSPTAIDWAYTIDGNVATYLSMTQNQDLFLNVKIPEDIWQILTEADGTLQIINSMPLNATAKYWNPHWDGGTGGFSYGEPITTGTFNWIFTQDYSGHGREDNQSDQNNLWTVEEINECEFGIAVANGETDFIMVREIKMILVGLLVTGLISRFTKSNPRDKARRRRRIQKIEAERDLQELFAIVEGAYFGSWIDAAGRSTNGLDAGDLVQHGAYPIECILRDELGLGDNEIDYNSFDLIGGQSMGILSRKDWKFASYISEQVNSFDLIAEFCQNCAIIYYQDYLGKEKVITTNPIGIYTTITPSKEKADPKYGSKMQITKSPLDLVYNEFHLHYKKNYATGIYEGYKYIKPFSHNLVYPNNPHPDPNDRLGNPSIYSGLGGLLHLSGTTYAKVNSLTFYAEWIRDEATAERLIKWFADWFCFRSYVVEFTTDLGRIALELGDQLLIDHPLIPTDIRNDHPFIITEIKHDLNNDELQFKAREIWDSEFYIT